jgi:hypothetical protein
LLVGSLVTALLSVALITKTLEIRHSHPDVYRAAEAAILVSVVIGLSVGLTDLGAKASLAAMVVLLMAPVAAGLIVWRRHSEPDVVGFT